ncbi:MAG: asparagine synthetase B, partial [Lentisphaeria bacterium]|nr:asparagine synthetase B [Lentisphaeria bacterium]
KAALAGLIAPAVAAGRKRGFAVPLGEWFRNEWYTLLCEHLLEGNLVKDNWMDRRALNELILRHKEYRRDSSELLGALLMLELFLENN